MDRTSGVRATGEKTAREPVTSFTMVARPPTLKRPKRAKGAERVIRSGWIWRMDITEEGSVGRSFWMAGEYWEGGEEPKGGLFGEDMLTIPSAQGDLVLEEMLSDVEYDDRYRRAKTSYIQISQGLRRRDELLDLGQRRWSDIRVCKHSVCALTMVACFLGVSGWSFLHFDH